MLSAATYQAKTASELFLLVGEMTLMAHALAEKHGYDFPLESGRFVEGEPEVYSLAARTAD